MPILENIFLHIFFFIFARPRGNFFKHLILYFWPQNWNQHWIIIRKTYYFPYFTNFYFLHIWPQNVTYKAKNVLCTFKYRLLQYQRGTYHLPIKDFVCPAKATQLGCVYVTYLSLTNSRFCLTWARKNQFEAHTFSHRNYSGWLISWSILMRRKQNGDVNVWNFRRFLFGVYCYVHGKHPILHIE